MGCVVEIHATLQSIVIAMAEARSFCLCPTSTLKRGVMIGLSYRHIAVWGCVVKIHATLQSIVITMAEAHSGVCFFWGCPKRI